MRQKLAALILIALCMGLFQHYEKNYVTANEYIRYFSILAWDDAHTTSLDPVFARLFPGWKKGDPAPNEDCAKVGGHYFLDKAPGLSILGAVLHPIIKLFINPYRQGWIELQVLTFLLITLPALIFLFLIMFRGSRYDPVVVLIFAMGTPFLLYSTVFFGILPAGMTAYGGYILVTKHDRPFWGGLTVGAAILLEYPAAALVAAISLIVLFGAPTWQKRMKFSLGFLPIIIFQLGYNTMLFGNPLVFSYAHKANPVLAGIMQTGVMGFGIPTLHRIYGLLLSPERGLFFISPILILSLSAFFRPIRGRITEIVRDWDRAIIIFVTLLILTGFTDWKAGNAAGPRHLIVILPFLIKPLKTGIQRLGQWTLGKFAVLLLSFWSVFNIWLVNGTFFYLSKQIVNPIYHESMVLLLNNCIYPTIFSQQPLAGLIAWMLALVFVWLWISFGLFGWKRPLHSVTAFFAALVLTMIVIVSLNTTGDTIPKQQKHVYAELNRVRKLRNCRENKLAHTWIRLIPVVQDKRR